MALLDRVKERVECDLTDPELQRLIDEALTAIEDAVGPIADPNNPITVELDGDRRKLDIVRPIDVDENILVVEYSGHWGAGEHETTLEVDDFRVRNGGRTLERLTRGTNSRSRWGARVEITYVPVNDGNARQEVTIKLVQLAVEYRGVASERIGDSQTSYTAGTTSGGLIYSQERDRLLASLAPRGGLLLR